MRRDPNQNKEVRLPDNPPVVHPQLSRHPAVNAYQNRLAGKKASPPVAGGDAQHIPLLTQDHVSGMTMAQQAPQQKPTISPDRFPANPNAPGNKVGFPPPNIRATDVLPPEAKEDPMFQHGQGSMYAHTQPELAYKYGVVRDNKRISPQQLREGTNMSGPTKGRLSEQTIQGLKALEEARKKTESPDAVAEAEANRGPSAAAARINDQPTTFSEDDKKRIESATKDYDEYDWNVLKELMTKDILNNEEQRKLIEEAIEAAGNELNLDSLIMEGYVTQNVPVKRGLEYEFRSMSGEVSLALKRMLMQESDQIKAPDRYYLDKYSFMTVAAGVMAINRRPLPSMFDSNGNFSEELFWEKFNFVMRLPLDLIASLGLNYHWFEIRVRKLFAAEKVKNG